MITPLRIQLPATDTAIIDTFDNGPQTVKPDTTVTINPNDLLILTLNGVKITLKPGTFHTTSVFGVDIPATILDIETA